MPKNPCFHFFLPRAILAAVWLLLLTNSALAAEVTLAWDGNTEADLAGYDIYYQKNPPVPDYLWAGNITLAELADPSIPTFTVSGLDEGAVYLFAVTASDTSGNESSFSIPVCAEVGTPNVVVPCPTSADGGGSSGDGSGGDGSGGGGSGGGGGGGGCFIGSVAGQLDCRVAGVLGLLPLIWLLVSWRRMKRRLE